MIDFKLDEEDVLQRFDELNAVGVIRYNDPDVVYISDAGFEVR
jgi:hypothetical protein